MIKSKIKIGILIGVVIVAVLVFIHPLLFKKNHIEKLMRIKLPNSCEIIDYEHSFDGLFGFGLNYAKIEIDKNTYDSINATVIAEIDTPHQYFVTKKNYKSLNLINVEEMKCGEEMGSKFSLIGGATTRTTYYIAAKEETDRYYIYIFSI